MTTKAGTTATLHMEIERQRKKWQILYGCEEQLGGLLRVPRNLGRCNPFPQKRQPTNLASAVPVSIDMTVQSCEVRKVVL